MGGGCGTQKNHSKTVFRNHPKPLDSIGQA